MRHHPLKNSTVPVTVRDLLSRLSFCSEVVEDSNPKRRAAELLRRHLDKREEDQEVSAELFSDFLETVVLNPGPAGRTVGKAAIKQVMRDAGLLDAVRLSDLRPLATAVYLHLFAIPRKHGIPVLPDKKFGWIGIEKAAQDPRAALYYYAKLVRPVERFEGRVYEEARNTLARGMAKRSDTALCAVALFDFEPTPEMRDAALQDPSAFGILSYAYFAGEEINSEIERRVEALAEAEHEKDMCLYLISLLLDGSIPPARRLGAEAQLSLCRTRKDAELPGFSQAMLSAPTAFSAVVLCRAARFQLLPSRAVNIADGLDLLHSKSVALLARYFDRRYPFPLSGEEKKKRVIWLLSDWNRWWYSPVFDERRVRERELVKTIIRSFDPSPDAEKVALSLGPLAAYEYARRAGSSDTTRSVACKHPRAAFLYAKDVDKGPRDGTRKAASKTPLYALKYALHVDRGPHDATRVGASENHKCALLYALKADKGPHPVTRVGACRGPVRGWYSLHQIGESALSYAAEVDKQPHPMTRSAASLYGHAVDYAYAVDKGPHPVTRAGACADAATALQYAVEIDRGPHPDTFAAVRGSAWEDAYRSKLGEPDWNL